MPISVELDNCFVIQTKKIKQWPLLLYEYEFKINLFKYSEDNFNDTINEFENVY